MSGPLREVTLATLTAYGDAWRAGDLERVLAAYADDVVFHYTGAGDLAGTHVGKAASIAAMAQTATRASRQLVEIVDVLAGEHLGSIVAVERFARPDAGIAPVEVRRTFVYRVTGDGAIAECWVLDEDQALMDRLWA